MIGLGSCNDVVREFEIHSLKRACRALKKNHSRRIDLGMALSGEKVLRYYPGQASIGLAVLINQYVENVVKRSPRLGKYQTLSGLRGGWQALRSADLPMELTVEYENGVIRGEFILAVFNNIRYYAAGKMATPQARTDDGLLDAFLVKKCSFSRLAYITFFTPPAAYAEKKETVVHPGAALHGQGEPAFLRADRRRDPGQRPAHPANSRKSSSLRPRRP